MTLAHFVLTAYDPSARKDASVLSYQEQFPGVTSEKKGKKRTREIA